jgi:hypothetical protein
MMMMALVVMVAVAKGYSVTYSKKVAHLFIH